MVIEALKEDFLALCEQYSVLQRTFSEVRKRCEKAVMKLQIISASDDNGRTVPNFSVDTFSRILGKYHPST